MSLLLKEGLQLTTQARKKLHVRGPFSTWFVIHILVRNKLIFHVVFPEEDDKKIIIEKCVSHVPNAYFSPLLVDTKAL